MHPIAPTGPTIEGNIIMLIPRLRHPVVLRSVENRLLPKFYVFKQEANTEEKVNRRLSKNICPLIYLFYTGSKHKSLYASFSLHVKWM